MNIIMHVTVIQRDKLYQRKTWSKNELLGILLKHSETPEKSLLARLGGIGC